MLLIAVCCVKSARRCRLECGRSVCSRSRPFSFSFSSSRHGKDSQLREARRWMMISFYSQGWERLAENSITQLRSPRKIEGGPGTGTTSLLTQLLLLCECVCVCVTKVQIIKNLNRWQVAAHLSGTKLISLVTKSILDWVLVDLMVYKLKRFFIKNLSMY